MDYTYRISIVLVNFKNQMQYIGVTYMILFGLDSLSLFRYERVFKKNNKLFLFNRFTEQVIVNCSWI
jgi:hypothetical protein